MTVFEALVAALRRASEYNKADQAAPACILWTDKDRQWEPLLPRLRELLPILTLGNYALDVRTGPAIWIRCMIARALPDVDYEPEGNTPILYLPGISRQELRAVEDCPRLLQPLAELQYRGAFFTQKSARDWTIAAFLMTNDGGLGLPLNNDGPTREAMQRALLPLSLETVDALQKDAPLSAAKFNSLLNPEPVRNLLLYLDDAKGQRAARDPLAWSAFRATCQHQFGYDPETDGEITGARLLGERQGDWNHVWNRFAEAPAKYPRLPELLRRACPKAEGGLFAEQSSWPQKNEAGETELRNSLLALDGCVPADARSAIRALDAKHEERRNWVWAELGLSPLATTLPALVALADATEIALVGATPTDIARAYVTDGWKADAAALNSLAIAEKPGDLAAVKTAIETLYRQWLRTAAEGFQAAVMAHSLPSVPQGNEVATPKHGRCYLFADGLRYDCGQQLAAALTVMKLDVRSGWTFCALPSITASSKPAATPVASRFGSGAELTPRVLVDGATVTADILRRELAKAGYEVLQGSDDTGTGTAGWTEIGAIDSRGHEQGCELARLIPGEIARIAQRIHALLDAGWDEVQVVTDHGWLLLPGGLPKAELPEHLTVKRKGRCARLTPDAYTVVPTVFWQWDASVRIAVAPGISCFVAGKEYEHGGLSPQECVTPVLTVRATPPTGPAAAIISVRWTGLRCKIQVEGALPGSLVDIRSKPADSLSTVAAAPKPISADGQVSLVVPEDRLEGQSAVIVLLGGDGSVIAQTYTLIGNSG
jgi:hypothetical protein